MIYTLYSFKGGVGRSMALANLGAFFCSRGLRVVMIDWDLEAPGLENYFYSVAEDTGAELARASTRPGLIDMLVAYKEKFPGLVVEARIERRQTSPEPLPEILPVASEPNGRPEMLSAVSADAIREAEEVAEITRAFREKRQSTGSQAQAPVQIETRQPTKFSDILDRNFRTLEAYLQPIETSSSAGGLWLLASGARPPEAFGHYADAVQDFDWLDFIASYEGKAYLEWLRGKLSAFADVVLIDSRTGVTEMGGICTRQMADAVVAFCAPNNQNIDGVAKILSGFDTLAARKARYDRNLDVVVIPTRLDDSESGPMGEFSARFAEKFENKELLPGPFESLDRPLWNLQIPYIPKFNFRERLVINPSPFPSKAQARLDPPTEKLIKAYENIAVHLAVLAPPESAVRAALQSEIAGSFPHLLRSRPPHDTPALPGNWVDRPAMEQQVKDALLDCARAPKGGRLGIWGQAGVGKTTLLARVCQDDAIQGAFPDGILWLNLEGAWGTDRVQAFLRTQFALPPGGGKAALLSALERRKFLFVVDDAWTADQLDAVFEFGRLDSRVIITRDLATASHFADSVVTVGMFSPDEAGALLKIPPPLDQELKEDLSLNWLLRWPLGVSLLCTALERQSAHGDSPEQAWKTLRAQLQRSGLRLLDRPETTGRNGSLDLSLRETLNRLEPEARRLLIRAAKGTPINSEELAGSQDRLSAGREKRSAYRSPARQLIDLGLAEFYQETLFADYIVKNWLFVNSQLTEDTDAKRKQERRAALERGFAIIRGQAASLDEMERIAYQAKEFRAFSLARKLLALARQHHDASSLKEARKLKMLQQHALCTYKDDDTILEDRLSEARRILDEGDLQKPTPSQETLGLAGSIYKQQWRHTGQRRDLEHSLQYYARGAAADLAGDFGYTRINAAFVLDLLATQEMPAAPDSAQSRRRQASIMREEIVAKLPGLASQAGNTWLKGEWWYGATMAESLFGLGRYSEARYWLREALALDPPAWQLEATTRQIASLAQAQGADTSDDSEAGRTIAMLVGDATQALDAIRMGKTGLALSGGGFRASLFHIGVLARLAEIDMLRHIEVLSCVSGGSIIGAHYYLEVRRLLQKKRDRDISRADYIEVVKRIERDFLAGVQMNLRVRLFAGWTANFRSIFRTGYTRTRYLGTLLEKHIFSRVQDGGRLFLSQLQIIPQDGSADFNPKLDNWRRGAKAPILLLNATTLNTGHVWQFAVNWMGEPPVGSGTSVDSNDLLRRMYYNDAPDGHQDVPLGLAVAASACVPGLFDPVELNGLFAKRSVRLVDGGVHDNQGIAGLLEQDCSVMLISDASGQMNSQPVPGSGIFKVFKRTQDISMARIREAEFQELTTLRRSSALNGLMFLHLKKDLDTKHIDWVGCQEPYDSSANPVRVRRGATLTYYGMPKNIQGQLAGLRTDLDTFSDAEAYALMLSGYRMATSDAAPPSLPLFPVRDVPREAWNFLAVEAMVDRATDFEQDYERLQRVLQSGSKLALKSWQLRPLASSLALVPLLLAIALLAAGYWAVWRFLFLKVFSGFTKNGPVSILGFVLHGKEVEALVLLFLVLVLVLFQWIARRKSLTVLLTGIVTVAVGWVPARFHLALFDRLYRSAGSVRARVNPRASVS